jgi:glutamate decarboxylase
MSNDRGMIAPAYTGRLAIEGVPALRIPDESMEPEIAYRFIHDELMLDGNSRLNLATFVTTWMDPQAERLMAETFDKNMIDKDEYPLTAAIESRCVSMVADLFNAPGLDPEDASTATGASTIGSSEAVMLGGLARTLFSAATSRWCGRSSAGISRSNRVTCRWRRDATSSRPNR